MKLAGAPVSGAWGTGRELSLGRRLEAQNLPAQASAATRINVRWPTCVDIDQYRP
jgi:hypothetical protein